MSKNLVRHTMHVADPPPLSDAQWAEVAALAALSDEAIDTSDIPTTREGFWRNAVRGRFYQKARTSAVKPD